MRALTTIFLGAFFLIGGCAASNVRPAIVTPDASGLAAQDDALAVTVGPSGGPGLTAARGALSVAIKWPEGYTTQAIPLSATRLDLFLKSGTTIVATASVVRPETTASMNDLDAGPLTLLAEARRTDGSLVASGSVELTVYVNRVVTAGLRLIPVKMPYVSFLSPEQGVIESGVKINGSDLSAPPGSTYSVLIDGRAVPQSSLFPGSSVIEIRPLPDWTSTHATITVTVDGIPAETQPVYRRLNLGWITISPAEPATKTNQPIYFTATAFEQDGSTVSPDPKFFWEITSQPPNSEGAFTINMNTGHFVATAEGSCDIRASLGNTYATTSVRINGIGSSPPPSGPVMP